MARIDLPADHRAGRPAGVLASRRVVGSGLLAVLVVVVLGTAAGGPEWIRSWLIASLLVGFAGMLIVGRYWTAATDNTSSAYLVAARLVLCIGLLSVLYQSRTPGYGLGMHRGIETAVVFVALVAFYVLAGDSRRYDAFQWLVLGCFAVVAGIFFYHSVSILEVSVRSRHPLWWGVTAGVCLAVLPQYVSREAFLWTLSRLAALLVLFGLPVYAIGEYSLFGLQFGFQDSYTIPMLEYEVQAMRSLFIRGNALATVVLPGLIAAVAEFYRAYDQKLGILSISVAGVFVTINALGLALSYGRALWVITPMALGIYVSYILYGRRVIPLAFVAGFAYLIGGIVAVHTGVIKLPEHIPTRGQRWYPGFAAILDQPKLLGEGLIDSGQHIAAYHPTGSSGSPHNSYLSIWIRTGIIGGISYIGIVGMSLFRGIWRYRDVDIAVLVLAVIFAAHQQFEAYTLFQTWGSSVLATLVFGMLVFAGPAIE